MTPLVQRFRFSPALRSSLGLAFSIIWSAALVSCQLHDAGDSSNARSVERDLHQGAPDPTELGPLAVTVSEYKLPAAIDPEIIPGRVTELWAAVYRPAELPPAPHPLLVFLHGNHGTCGKGSDPRRDDNSQYTTKGTCPDGYVVVPNHLGYGYLAERLASHGYIVVSINANRGINAADGVTGDDGLNLARGRLILKHLQKLAEWATNPGTTPDTIGADLSGTIDFAQVGLFGHSRGGEGARAAYNLYVDNASPWPHRIGPRVTFKGIFEVGPVDGQTSRVLDAFGTAWNVILPMCDGDVRSLKGMRPFDRMLHASGEAVPSAKGLFAVWGANHNFYNTEWQETDSYQCVGPDHKKIFEARGRKSLPQQSTALASAMAFFRGYVGRDADPTYARLLDPRYAMPTTFDSITRYERAFTEAIGSPHEVLVEDFSRDGGIGLHGAREVWAGLSDAGHCQPFEHPNLAAACLKWESPDAGAYFQSTFGSEGSTGIDVREYSTFEFRTSLAEAPAVSPVGYSIQLVNEDGELSKQVKLSDVISLRGPAGHSVLEGVRIPLADFGNVTPHNVRGVRFSFDDSPAAHIYIASMRFSKAPVVVSPQTRSPIQISNTVGANEWGDDQTLVTTGNKMSLIAKKSGEIEIHLYSDVLFEAKDELLALRVGPYRSVRSRYNDDGDMHHVIFTLGATEFSQLGRSTDVTVQYDTQRSGFIWSFGALQ